MHIRRIRDSDREQVQRLHRVALAAVGADVGPGPWDDDLDQIERVYLTARGEFLVGILDGRVVAMGALRRVDEQIAELKRMRVLPGYQRQGFGRRILRALEARAGELGYNSIVLDTAVRQAAAIGLYRTEGYLETGRGEFLGLPTLSFRKALATEVIDNRANDLQLALEASDLASDLALAYFESGVSATLKADGTPVTEADRAVERLIRETLSAARPHDALLGEELGRLGESNRVWIIDPIDGTSFFSRRDPNWRVHIALEIAGSTEIAVVTAPALRRCWWATRGGGAFESSWPREQAEPKRLEVSTTSVLADARLDALDDTSIARLPPSAAHRPASPLPLVELVRGEIDAFLVERYHIWDHAPWILLVEEAGGRFTDRTGGHAGDQGGGLYSNANLHSQLLTALQYSARP